MERRPTEKDDERLCLSSYCGLGDNAGDDGGFNVKVMSMLPPPKHSTIVQGRAKSIERLRLVGSEKRHRN